MEVKVILNKAKTSLLKGTVVYFIGNVLISIIQFLLLPIITGKLSPTEYGYFDLIVSSANVITPIATLQVTDAVFRFFFNSDEEEKQSYFSVAVIVISTGLILSAVTLIVINFLIMPIQNLSLVLMYFASNIILSLYTKMARALNKNTLYVKCNILRSLLYITLQIFTLVILKLGIESLFISNILSCVITIIILELFMKTREYLNINSLNRSTFKEMLKFSVPLIPNSLLWWLVSSVNTYIITIKIGMYANGIFTVANKFSSIITMITGVFLLAWQESVIREYNTEGSKSFFNDIFDKYIRVISSITILVIPLIKIVMPYMIDATYKESMIYAPILIISAGVSSITGFYGPAYLANKNTTGSMLTTIYGTMANILIVSVFINKFGLIAPAIATLVANILIAIVRHYSLNKEMGIILNKRVVFILIIETIICLFIYYYNGIGMNITALVIGVLISMMLNKNSISELLKILNTKISERRI